MITIPAIDAAMQSFIDCGELAGAVTLVADRQRVVHFSPQGVADIQRNQPTRLDTIFWIASMTKPITAAAVLMLQDGGQLSVDDPVAKYLPEFSSLKTPSGKPANITLRQCLAHTSGLAEAANHSAARNLAELVPQSLTRPTNFEPGTQWMYCQSSINTAARVVEVVSGKSFPQFLDEQLFVPLGMKDTTFYLGAEQMPRLATSYSRSSGQLAKARIFLLSGAPDDRNRYPAANGGLFSTASDYLQFSWMMLNGGRHAGRQFLQPQTVQVMTSIQTGQLKAGFTPGMAWGVGCGIVREPLDVTAMLSQGTFGHGGAFGTQAWIDPAKGRIYLLMIARSDLPNSDASEFRGAFQQAAADALD